MASVPFQYNGNFGVGPGDTATHAVNIQPVLPVAAGDWKLVNRVIIPVSYIPNSAAPAAAAHGAELGLGDINDQRYFVPAEPGGVFGVLAPPLLCPPLFATSGEAASGAPVSTR